MANIRGIEYQVTSEYGEKHWVQFGDSEQDLRTRGYPREQSGEISEHPELIQQGTEEIFHQAADELIETKEK